MADVYTLTNAGFVQMARQLYEKGELDLEQYATIVRRAEACG